MKSALTSLGVVSQVDFRGRYFVQNVNLKLTTQLPFDGPGFFGAGARAHHEDQSISLLTARDYQS